MVAATREDDVCGSAKQADRLRKKKSGRAPKGDTGKASHSHAKGGNKKAKPTAIADPWAATSPSKTSTSKKTKIGFQVWTDRLNGTKKN